MRQRLTLCHAASHVPGGCSGAGAGGNCEATGLDEEQGLFGFCQGALEEGDCGNGALITLMRMPED